MSNAGLPSMRDTENCVHQRTTKMIRGLEHQGEAKRAGTVQPGEYKAHEGLIDVYA